jgi:hypothetical protein
VQDDGSDLPPNVRILRLKDLLQDCVSSALSTANSFSFQYCRGMLAMEELNLEAGQLGPVLLFSLMAHGVGYTSASKVQSQQDCYSKF